MPYLEEVCSTVHIWGPGARYLLRLITLPFYLHDLFLAPSATVIELHLSDV